MKLFINKNRNKNYIILDIPLFLENKLNKKNDVIIFIQSSQANIIKKLKKRKNYNRNLHNRFKQIQLSLKIKKTKSNFIIKNSFDHKKALKDINKVMKEII